jgi:hypothetical protein
VTREALLKAMTKPLYQMDLQQRMVPGERTDAEFEEEWEHWKATERHKRMLPMHMAYERAQAVLAAMEGAGCAVVPAEPLPEACGAWYRVKNAHHFADEPAPADTSDYAAYRALVRAAAI